eukprot:TRINITY_DN4495_c0_g1_i3.p1 TRINITY_DN4495_c0_g1~~TRINITY_DN4495_c0_g1_i3.p1  ORF type:complete len:170 (-),score=67.18 TRINITY_DN4495_c0_g1_i3:35-544(-)
MCIRDRRRVHGEYISSLLSTSTSTRKKRETRMSGGEDLVQIQKKIEEMTAKVEEKDKLLMEIAHKLSDVHNQYQQALENKEAMIKDMHTLRTKLESKDNQLRQELKDKDVIVQKLQSLEKENEKLKKQAEAKGLPAGGYGGGAPALKKSPEPPARPCLLYTSPSPRDQA